MDHQVTTSRPSFPEIHDEHLESLGWDVKVCLPDSQKSWISRAFMIKDEIKVRYYNRSSKQIVDYKCDDSDLVLLSGTPATCVNIALNHIYKDIDFDLVIGGPNFGRNITTIYTLASGTIGCAMEGVMNGKKAIALSFCFCNRDLASLKNCCETASDAIQHLYEIGNWPEGGLFNINIPMVDYRCPYHLTTFYHEKKTRSLFTKVEGKETKFIFNHESDHGENDAPYGTDKWAVLNKYVSVTPMVASYKDIVSPDTTYGLEELNENTTQ
ncbi:sure-like protein [Backusella circina FSU 941]|nr:sure-like protein [Backusella circina FSU 941]